MNFALAGVIGGTGHLTKTGAGILVFQGPDHNTFVGDTFVTDGPLYLAKPPGVTAVPAALSIGTPAGLFAAVVNYNSYQVIGNIFVNRGGLLRLNGQTENVDHLWLTEGGDVQTTTGDVQSPTGVLLLKAGGSIQVVPGAVSDAATIVGNLDMDAGAHVINVASRTSAPGGPELEIAARVMSTFGAVTLQKQGAGTLRLTADNTYGGITRVDAGALQVDGSQPGSGINVFDGARLMGTGRVGSVAFASVGGAPGVVAPGHSPGVLTCASFNAGSVGGTLRIELSGLSPGIAGHDQLYVRSALGVASLENVTMDASLHFASAVNDQFRIIRKDGDQPVVGEFTGLPEGANFYISGEQFTITYAGGDGNDVVLTRILTPPRPVLTIQTASLTSVRLLWPTGAISDGYALQSTTNLGTDNWTATLSLPVTTGTNNVVTNTTGGDARKFYRLLKP
jgi:autotransporter-associated beta strand protein